MSFAEKLKSIRKERNITQEQLAELLAVSRQAVSKWESGNGYPETEKLLIISKELNISLDYLFNQESNPLDKETTHKATMLVPSGKIAIPTYDSKSVVICHAVKSSKILASGKAQPKYLLLGVDKVTFWGDHTIILGWYETLEDIQHEIIDITSAIAKGEASYTLKYNADVELVGLFSQPRLIKK